MRRVVGMASLARIAVMVSTMLLSACGTVSITYLDPRTFAAHHVNEILVIMERPTRPHLLIASLTVKSEGFQFTRDQLLERLRREAARLGGDALVLYADTNTRLWLAGGVLLGSAPTVRERQLMADVIVFTDSSFH